MQSIRIAIATFTSESDVFHNMTLEEVVGAAELQSSEYLHSMHDDYDKVFFKHMTTNFSETEEGHMKFIITLALELHDYPEDDPAPTPNNNEPETI